jgi:hypothetical protein
MTPKIRRTYGNRFSCMFIDKSHVFLGLGDTALEAYTQCEKCYFSRTGMKFHDK